MLTKCHFIGIGGIGMSGLAKILLKQNVQVSGSDIAINANTKFLSHAGANIFIGHSENNIQAGMTVVFSSDIASDNPELTTAKQLQCPLWHRSDLLNQLMQNYKSLVVSGTHGKTTTTSLLLTVLLEGGLEPAYAVGGIVNQLQSNAGFGSGEYFVAEGDESDGTFLKYSPHGAIVTNIDLDHMNYYKNEEALIQAFDQFIKKVSSASLLFWCGDDQRLTQLDPPGTSYGFGEHCELIIKNFRQEGWTSYFDILFEGKLYSSIQSSLTGVHNAQNAAAVFGLALRLGVKEEQIRKALLNFEGVKRRCEKKGSVRHAEIYDDYAHHPTEIETTLKAVRDAIGERRLVAIFQPHRFSRMQHCLGLFGTCFKEADEIIVTDLYSAGEVPIEGVSTEALLEEIRTKHVAPCYYVPRIHLKSTLLSTTRPHDVIVTLGAGDITKLGSDLAETWQEDPPRKLEIGIICGGQSVEHEVSIKTARYFSESLNPEIYNTHFFTISKQGRWFSGETAQDVYKNDLTVVPEGFQKDKLSGNVVDALQKCDIVLPVLHGTYGEDGTIQGMFEMMSIAYMGCGYEASIICMNKALTKKLMQLNGIPILPFLDFSSFDWHNNPQEILSNIQKDLSYPVYVKPVHLGSSVGIMKVINSSELVKAIENAFLYDNHIIVENGLSVREIEFAVLGNDKVIVFPPGERLTGGDFYSYEDKYSENAKPINPKVDLPPKLIQEGIALVEKAYRTVGGQGLSRVDTFLDKDNKFWLNEINPIPGACYDSLFPSICRTNGIDGNSMMDLLIILGMKRRRKRDLLKV